MNWFSYCLLTIALYGAHDIVLKHMSVNTNASVASFVINASAAIGIVLFLLFGMVKKSTTGFQLTGTELIWLIGAGVSLGLATVTFMKAFSHNGAFSLVVPTVYVGIIAISLVVGCLLFNEKITTPQIAGLVFSCLGIYLMVKS